MDITNDDNNENRNNLNDLDFNHKSPLQQKKQFLGKKKEKEYLLKP